MKLIGLTLCLLITSVCLGNDVDALQSNHDVNRFLAKKVHRTFKKNPPLEERTDSARSIKSGRNKFYKMDIDNNGLTDLIVYGYDDLIVVLDDGDGTYSFQSLETGTFSLDQTKFLSIDSTSNPKKIIVQYSKNTGGMIDTLVAKFHRLIEFNANPLKEFNFEKITYKTTGCFGTCPQFEMTINKDRSVTYNAIQYNNEKGKSRGILPRKDFDELIELLKYLQPDKLKNSYELEWTDDETAITTFDYNGISKKISDYGEIGTFGLRFLYLKFIFWRSSVEWSE